MKKILAIMLLFTTISFAQFNGVTWETASIDSGETIGATVDLRGNNKKVISISVDTTNWTSANLTIDAYNPKTSKWEKVEEDDGSVFTITIGSLTVPVRIILSPLQMSGLERIRFVSSAAQDDGDVTIYAQARPY